MYGAGELSDDADCQLMSLLQRGHSWARNKPVTERGEMGNLPGAIQSCLLLKGSNLCKWS